MIFKQTTIVMIAAPKAKVPVCTRPLPKEVHAAPVPLVLAR